MQVSVLGCGWLGLPLAESFIREGYSVKGSVTSPEKLELLAKARIDPYCLALSPDAITGNISGFLGGSLILIINIPPKTDEGSFVAKMRQLIPHIAASRVRHVLFVSSISVYGDNPGSVDEATPPLPLGKSGRQLLEAERLLLDNPLFSTTVVRFGGLIGGDRHPVYHLAGRKGLENPHAPINLIHRNDCIGILLTVIQKSAWGAVFNAVAPLHPTRKEYYTKKAEELGLQIPDFEATGGSDGKIIAADKVIKLLGHCFGAL